MSVLCQRLRISLCLTYVLIAGILSGCNDQPKKKPAAKKTAVESTTVAKSDAKAKPADKQKPPPFKPPAQAQKQTRNTSEGFSMSRHGNSGFGSVRPDIANIDGSGMSGGGMMSGDYAFDKIENEIRNAANRQQSLIVFVVDQSASNILNGIADRAGRLFAGGGNNSATSKNLSAAVVAFGEQVSVLTPQPIKDGPQLTKLLREQNSKSPAGKLAYAAVLKAAQEFGKFRDQDYEVLFVLVAAEAEADEEQLKQVAPLLKRNFIPVYSSGRPEPFYAKGLKPVEGKPATASWKIEHITLYTPARINEELYNDSGYGNFGLERICRASEGGKFFRATTGRSPTGWDTEANGEIKANLLAKYAPDYISKADYENQLNANKAKSALVKASTRLVEAEFEPPQLSFPGGDGENQARINTAITEAQKKAANPGAEFQAVLDILAAGEADRGKLNNPRWEAAFDLALGRAYAAMARTLGYNIMLASLKNGKSFTKPNSTMWVLKPSDNFEMNSQLITMSKKSREALQRVVANHPGTPWADIAQKELAAQCGWVWEEQ